MHVEEMKICTFLENMHVSGKFTEFTEMFAKSKFVLQKFKSSKNKNKIDASLLWVSAYSNLATKEPRF